MFGGLYLSFCSTNAKIITTCIQSSDITDWSVYWVLETSGTAHCERIVFVAGNWHRKPLLSGTCWPGKQYCVVCIGIDLAVTFVWVVGGNSVCIFSNGICDYCKSLVYAIALYYWKQWYHTIPFVSKIVWQGWTWRVLLVFLAQCSFWNHLNGSLCNIVVSSYSPASKKPISL